MAERSISYWKDAWDQDDIGFHSLEVHKMIQKDSSLLFKEGETQKIFVPLCGKTVDMKWFLDQGQVVIGLDGVKKALDDFCKEHKLDMTEDEASGFEQEFQMLKANNGRLKLYFGNMLHFNKSIEGEFDCIWDRGSLVALDRKDMNNYVEVLKDILKPGGKIFLEVFEYDKAMFEGMALPNSVFEDELRSLFEPHCTVEMVEKDKLVLADKDVDLVYYMIVKK